MVGDGFPNCENPAPPGPLHIATQFKRPFTVSYIRTVTVRLIVMVMVKDLTRLTA